MSAESDAKFAALAKRLIDANGRSVTVISSSGYTYTDASKPWEGVTSEDVTFTLIGVFTKVSSEQLKSLEDKRKTAIEGDVRGLLVPASDVTVAIATGDKIIDSANSKRYEVLESDKVQPGDGEIIYKLIVSG